MKAMLILLGVGALVLSGGYLRSREVSPAAFRRQLLASGLYVLPCGGGALVDPPRAVSVLRWRHAPGPMIEAAWNIFLTEPRDDEISQAAFDLARGVLYALGDQALIERLLIQLRQTGAAGTVAQGLGAARGLPPRQGADIQLLVAALCKRLHRPCPPGIKPLTPQQEMALFCWP